MAHLALCLLGVPQAYLDNKPLTDLATDKVRALLYYLAVEADTPHRREQLTVLLWPDQPEDRARQNLRQALSYLRQALGEAADTFLLISRDTVQLNRASAPAVDVSDFVALLHECRQHRHRRMDGCLACLRRLRQALALYHGDFLSGFSLPDSEVLEEWALLKREWLRQQAVEALAALGKYYERRGDWPEARECARRQVELEPWREEAHRQLMRLLAFTGERSAALAQYESCRRALAAELGIEPAPETTALYTQIQAGRLPPAPARRHNLPAAWDAFVGRQEELIDLADRLADPACRLVTLTGPGGIGKTRLALQSAAEHVGALPDGVWFVPLAGVSDASRVAAALAQALGLDTSSRVDPREQVLHALRDRELLLLLDGMEQLLPAVDLLDEILRRAPGVVLLVTSRERLRLREEWVYEVAGLAYPETLDDPQPYSALELYAERARQGNRRFVLADELPAVVRLCRLVEGMPLGLELAAAAGRPCAEVADEIERDLAVLSSPLRNVPARHASIRAAIEHSWRRLTEAQQRCFAQLATFQGGWTAAAAAAVAAAGGDDLQSLESKSLLRRDASGRWQMHALLRQYAAERLAERPADESGARDRHCAWYMALLERHAADLEARSPAAALAAVAADLENIHRSWRRAVEQRRWTEIARGLAGLARFYLLRGPFQEAAALFQEAAAPLTAAGGPLLARLLAETARFLDLQGRSAEAMAAAQSAVEHAEADEARGSADARLACAQALVLWGQVLVRMGAYADARARLEAGVGLAQASGFIEIEAAGRRNLGNVDFFLGDYQSARNRHTRALELHRQAGDRHGEGVLLNNLGGVWYQQGDYARARECYTQALVIRQELGDRWGEGSTLLNLGHLADAAGDVEEAGRFYQRALDIARALGDRRGEGLALLNLAANCADRGDYAAALAAAESAIELCREVDDRRSAAQALALLGSTCVRCGDYARARSCLDEARQVFDEVEDVRGQGEVLTHLAHLALAAERYAEARAYADASLRIAGEIGDPHIQGYGRTLLGHALAGQSLWVEAAAAYRQALAAGAELGFRSRRWEVRAALAAVALAAGRREEAWAEVGGVLAELAADAAARDAPLRVYLDCALVLRAFGEDDQAAGLIARAHELLAERAARIGAPALRRAFRENVAAHREVERLFAALPPR